MVSNKFKDLTTEELLKRKGLISKLYYALVGLTAIYGISMIYLMYSKQWNPMGPLALVPVSLLAFIYIISRVYSDVNMEIRSRK